MAHPLPLEVVTATNVAAAIQTATAFRPEVVLMLSVYPTWTALRLLGNCAKFPVANIFMAAFTGYGTHDDKVLSREAGFDEHLTKPVHSDVAFQSNSSGV